MTFTGPVAGALRRSGGTVVQTAPWAVVLVLMTSLCAPGYDGAPSGRAPERGGWGGEHLSLDVTASGADAEFDCAKGAVTEPIGLDSAGRFDVPGSYTPESPGPQREGQNGQPRSARYSGRVQGTTMTVTVRLTDTGDALGPFTVKHGQPPQLTKCR